MSDPINSPAHYTRGGVEAIDAIEAWELGPHLANVVKYVARAGHKGDELQDLLKAQWYLNRYINRLQSGPVLDGRNRECEDRDYQPGDCRTYEPCRGSTWQENACLSCKEFYRL